jgi:hypothetical protein
VKGIPAAVSCVLVLVALRPAQAADAVGASARLHLANGPGTEQCIDARALIRAVELRLQRHAFRQDLPATLYVQIAVQRTTDASWSAEISMRDGAGAFLGSRSIVTSAPHCSALDDSLALVVALLVDSPPVAAPVEPNPEPEPGVPPAVTPSSPPPTKPVFPAKTSTISLPRDTPARRQPWLFNVSVGGAAAIGMLPGVAPGVEIGVGARPPTVPEIRLFAGLYPARQQERAGAQSGARFSLASLGLELCPLDQALGAVHWFGCAGQTLGWVRVTAFGFDENTTTSHLTYALLASTGLTIPLVRSFAGRLGVRAEVPLERGIFTYGARDGSERGLFEMKPVTAALDAALIVEL